MIAVQPTARVAQTADMCEHAVAFYDSESFLSGCVAGFLAPALDAGDRGVVVQTADHRAGLRTALLEVGVDMGQAVATGQLIVVDAESCLADVMVDDSPDPDRFAATVAPLIDRASAGGRQVRVHGEMVAVLWERGQVAAALALETLWNEFLADRPFALLCSYPMRAFAGEEASEGFRHVCDQHAVVLPSESYSQLEDARARDRTVALLQQEAIAGINARTALRARQHELEEELRRADELGRLRDELIATLADALTAGAGDGRGRRRSTTTFAKTVVRAVRRTLGADACAIRPDDGPACLPRVVVGDDPGVGPERLDAPIPVGAATRGTLRVAPGPQTRAFTDEEVAFATAAAALVGVAAECRLGDSFPDRPGPYPVTSTTS